jgi:hypothetical protein
VVEGGFLSGYFAAFAIARRAKPLNEKWEKLSIFQEIMDKNPYLSVF